MRVGVFIFLSFFDSDFILVVRLYLQVYLVLNSLYFVVFNIVYYYILSNGVDQVMIDVFDRFQDSEWLLLELEDFQMYQDFVLEEIFSVNFYWKGNICKNDYL